MTAADHFRPMPLMRAALLLAALASAPAWSGCSRPIAVPLSPIGASVIIKGGQVGGIYPEMLRRIGAKEGCTFVFSAVPRARLEAMFEVGKVDLLTPATRTARRDELGTFVPMIASRATLVTVAETTAPIRSGAELLERREVRVALVRGFDFGGGYQQLVKQLVAQGRAYFEADPVAVARLLQAGIADATIMPPFILAGGVANDSRVEGLMARLRIEPIPELPWGQAGVYVSHHALEAADRALLIEALDKAGKAGAVFEGYQRAFPAETLTDTVRPR